MSFRFETALVVGATGFIGSALVRKLVDQNITVLAPILTSRKQSKRLMQHKNILPIEVKDWDISQLRKKLKGCPAEIVFNVASSGVPPQKREITTLLDGSINLLAVLIQALEEDTKKFIIHTGSWLEYGLQQRGSKINEDHPIEPTSLYGSAKAATHLIGSALAKQRGFSFTTLRLFHVYGAGEASFRLMPTLINKLYSNKFVDLTIGNQIRDFIYIDDVVDSFIVAARMSKKQIRPAFNICTGEPISIRNMAKKVADSLKKSHNLLHFGKIPTRPNEPSWGIGSNALFKNITGWQPNTSLKKGIKNMLDVNIVNI